MDFGLANSYVQNVATQHRVVVSKDQAGMRLDQVLGAAVPGLSRTSARKLLRLGGVFIDGKRTKIEGKILHEGQSLVVHLGAAFAKENERKDTEKIDVPILFEDDVIVVVDKPSGVFSAPTPESDSGDLLDLLATTRPHLHLVHRLDRPTSGVMVVAKTKRAAALLSEQFASHTLERSYLAIVVGAITSRVEVEIAIGGKPAHTTVESVEASPVASLVRATLHTGRTHQVRIHTEHLGHPIAGDSKYGRFLQKKLPLRAPRLCLHAEHLALRHPNGEIMAWSAPYPEPLREYFQSLTAKTLPDLET